MKESIVCTALAAFSLCLSGCASLSQVREDTKAVGLLVQSIGTSAEEYQAQRDLLARATLRNRQVLERIALRQEGDLAHVIAAWEIAGETERKRVFDAIRTQSDKVQAVREASKARMQQQETELRAAKSAVSFDLAKIASASGGLVKLGEPRSREDEARFLFGFAKELRADFVKDAAAAASAATTSANDSLSSKGNE
jgi:hypothetical protein